MNFNSERNFLLFAEALTTAIFFIAWFLSTKEYEPFIGLLFVFFSILKTLNKEKKIEKINRRIIWGSLILGIILFFGLRIIIKNRSDNDTFDTLVYVHEGTNKQRLISEVNAYLVIDIGKRRDEVEINKKGQAHITSIPNSFLNKQIPISISSGQYISFDTNSVYKLTLEPIYYRVKKICPDCIIFGTIIQGGERMQGVEVQIKGYNVNTTSNKEGFFKLKVPSDSIYYTIQIFSKNKLIFEKDSILANVDKPISLSFEKNELLSNEAGSSNKCIESTLINPSRGLSTDFSLQLQCCRATANQTKCIFILTSKKTVNNGNLNVEIYTKKGQWSTYFLDNHDHEIGASSLSWNNKKESTVLPINLYNKRDKKEIEVVFPKKTDKIPYLKLATNYADFVFKEINVIN